MTQIPFSSLPLPASLLQSLAQLGYENTTDIQASALPLILEGRDLIAQAPTGSGKTAAFGLGLLAPLNPRFFGCQSLVLSPTRELAAQITEELRKLARGMGNIKIVTLSGGVPFGPQAASLEQGAHVIVGTPGRVQDHLSRGTLQLDSLNCLVLDEADRMLDMGFVDAIREIVGHTPARRQTLLFSATYPPSLAQLTGDLLRDPAQVKVERASA
ncbi:MAG TPA: ATP-dependent RNA helicase DbpA, partial [Pseudomonas sp.]|nr:ATP-dependent RNA helicase DbpA [Pseudomonas sp.]